MMTLPESGRAPLVSCQRMRQTDGGRLNSAGSWGLARKIDSNVGPWTRASSTRAVWSRDCVSVLRHRAVAGGGAPRRACRLDLGGWGDGPNGADIAPETLYAEAGVSEEAA